MYRKFLSILSNASFALYLYFVYYQVLNKMYTNKIGMLVILSLSIATVTMGTAA